MEIVEKKNRNHLLNKNYLLVTFCNLIAQLGFSVSASMIAPYATQLGAEPFLLGIITGLLSIISLVSRPATGGLSDRWKKTLILTISLAALFFVFIGYSIAGDLEFLVAIRVIHGISFSVCTTVTLSLVSETILPGHMATGLGYFGLTTTLATAIAPSIGSLLVSAYGYSAMFRMIAFFYLAACILSVFIHVQQDVPSERKAEFGLSRLLAMESFPAAIIGFFNSFTNGAVMSFTLLFAAEKGIENASLYFIVFAIATLFSRPIIGKIADNTSPNRLVIPCGIFVVLSMFGMFFAGNLSVLLLAAVFFGFGYGGLQPVIQTMCLRKVGPDRTGVASGTYYLGLDGGNGLGPVVCSTVAGALGGYQYGFLAMIIPVLLGFCVFIFCTKKKYL